MTACVKSAFCFGVEEKQREWRMASVAARFENMIVYATEAALNVRKIVVGL